MSRYTALLLTVLVPPLFWAWLWYSISLPDPGYGELHIIPVVMSIFTWLIIGIPYFCFKFLRKSNSAGKPLSAIYLIFMLVLGSMLFVSESHDKLKYLFFIFMLSIVFLVIFIIVNLSENSDDSVKNRKNT